MNSEEQDRIANIISKLQQAIELRFVGPLYYALMRQLKDFVKRAKTAGLRAALSRIDEIVLPGEIEPIYKDIWAKGGIGGANRMYSIITGQPFKPRGLGFNPQWTAQVEKYLQVRGANKITQINQTSKDYISTVIQDGLHEGLGPDKIAKEIVRPDVPKARARLITRTESVGATNFGAMMGAAKTGLVMDKIWIATLDNRTRPAHADANKENVPFEKGFWVGGEMLRFPGDPDGSAANICNCRCVVAFEAKRDSSGKPMRREQPYLDNVIQF